MTGFRKINKKFDKNFYCVLGKEWFDSKVKESELSEGGDIENLINKVMMNHLTTQCNLTFGSSMK